MSISGNPETGGRPLSTADLAAAARRPDAELDDNEEPVLNEERPVASSDREERIQRQNAGGAEAQQRTTRRNVEQKISAGNEAHSAMREAEADATGTDVGERGGGANRTDVGGPDRAAEARPAEENQPPARAGRWFNEKASTSSESPPADTAARSGEALEALFTPDLAETYRLRWTSIQSGFVDDPRQAVRRGDELVAQIMTNLANTFAEERHRVEAQLDATGEGSTEELRVTLRRYRSFFERLLSL
jgi:hypothetical protein